MFPCHLNVTVDSSATICRSTATHRDSSFVEADRCCDNAVNPEVTPVATSYPVWSSFIYLKVLLRF